MKKFLLILAWLAVVLTGCTSGTQESAPEVLLNTPDRARDAAAAANDRAKQVQQELPQAPSAP